VDKTRLFLVENGIIPALTISVDADPVVAQWMVKIKPQEIIGVGDGPNDYPLLMGSGFKVAMGNAVPELKEIADFIAPSVEEDGVATVIEKFVLQ